MWCLICCTPLPLRCSMMVVLPLSCIWYANLLSVSCTVSAVACILVSSCCGVSAMIGMVSSSTKLASLRCTGVV